MNTTLRPALALTLVVAMPLGCGSDANPLYRRLAELAGRIVDASADAPRVEHILTLSPNDTENAIDISADVALKYFCLVTYNLNEFLYLD